MHVFIPFEFDDKATLIAYFNEEQNDELRSFALAFFEENPNTTFQVTILDIGMTGLRLTITQNARAKVYYLPFIEPITQRDELQQQYILLVQKAAKILGKTSIELKKRQFILLEKYATTANMVRLVLKSEQDLSHLPAGYAFLLHTEIPTQKTQRAVRYYTLRKAWQEITEQGDNENLAWIDVYCHGEKNGEISLGERWIKSLKIGDIVISEREFPEKIEHLNFNRLDDQALLIADETSMPTVARLLELWQPSQQAKPPIVITFLQHRQDFTYLDNLIKECPTKILPIVSDKNQSPHEQIFATLSDFLQQNPTQINSVWGGLEATIVKHLRPMLWNLLKLTRENMVLKVYWRSS